MPTFAASIKWAHDAPLDCAIRPQRANQREGVVMRQRVIT
jgi:hypothetical protein